jgi:hypothetical protein
MYPDIGFNEERLATKPEELRKTRYVLQVGK